MQSRQIHRWQWKTAWLSVCMMLGFGPAWGQSFAETLQTGQTIKVEWVQQTLNKQHGKQAGPIPFFPDELQTGESEIRVGFNLKSTGEQLIAEVIYISHLALPVPETNSYLPKTEDLLPSPIIIDTRFQDQYFNPQLFLFDVLSQEELPVSCQAGAYQQFFNQFAGVVVQASAATDLLPAQLDWLQETTLPAALSVASLADFFCGLMEMDVPKQESPMKIQVNKQSETYRVDYVQVDHPSKMCVLKGNIQSPATQEVRVKFFKEGDWLNYWQDTVLHLDREGSFQFTFSLDHARMVSLFHGYQSMRFYFEPGDTVQFETNANAFYREMQIQGTAKAENEFLLAFYHQMRGDTLYRSFEDQITEQDYFSFFQKTRAKETRELAFLAKQAPTLRTGFTAIMDRLLKLEYATIQWDAAYRFMVEKRITLDPDLLGELQKMATLLYRLPRGKDFDFDVEDFLSFQFYLLKNAHQAPYLSASDDWSLAQLLPSKETFVRHTMMQLFRKYDQLEALSPSSLWQLNQLLAITKDSQLIQEMTVFAEGKRKLPPAIGYQTLQKGKIAPSWSFTDKEGIKVALEDFKGKKLLLHIGWVENLETAMTDIELLQDSQDQLPEMVHLLAASSKDQFAKGVGGKKGLFVFVSPEEMKVLKDQYFIENRSNHYFLIGEDGRILANRYDLGTAKKLQGAWQKMATIPAQSSWTAEQKLQVWRTLGLGALVLLLISGIVLWQRRLTAKRNLRRQQLLEVELRGIRSQMNPHFLFNAMSSIQNLIRKQEQEKADLYLGQFAGLMRKTLRNTAEAYIPLVDEIETLEQYCSLESLRHPFQYQFQVDQAIDAHNTYIPSMILQPIIENAILHGLAPKAESRTLLIEISPGQKGLKCTITDNGIGILAAQKHQEKKNHQSVGMNLVRQRLELMGLDGQEHLAITDRSTLSPPAQGTLVSLTIPVEK